MKYERGTKLFFLVFVVVAVAVVVFLFFLPAGRSGRGGRGSWTVSVITELFYWSQHIATASPISIKLADVPVSFCIVLIKLLKPVLPKPALQKKVTTAKSLIPRWQTSSLTLQGNTYISLGVRGESLTRNRPTGTYDDREGKDKELGLCLGSELILLYLLVSLRVCRLQSKFVSDFLP